MYKFTVFEMEYDFAKPRITYPGYEWGTLTCPGKVGDLYAEVMDAVISCADFGQSWRSVYLHPIGRQVSNPDDLWVRWDGYELRIADFLAYWESDE